MEQPVKKKSSREEEKGIESKMLFFASIRGIKWFVFTHSLTHSHLCKEKRNIIVKNHTVSNFVLYLICVFSFALTIVVNISIDSVTLLYLSVTNDNNDERRATTIRSIYIGAPSTLYTQIDTNALKYSISRARIHWSPKSILASLFSSIFEFQIV